MSKAERQAAVEALTQVLKAHPNIFVTDFQGLNVQRMTELRRRLRGVGARYVVVKNTLAERALAANRVSGLDQYLAGPTGLVLSVDPLPAAKVVTEFAKEFEKPALKGGVVDGAAVSVAHIQRLGAIPPRETLLAMVAGTLSAVLANFVGCLEALREERARASNQP
ncbi:MAG TPA: 50S ribosomal protein L10 [Gemmatimonadales bacterium]|jgi:large subunit ribosomal protein L10|nr:50S ribosomal protein L10 [Gemmatimonadales bacterium]